MKLRVLIAALLSLVLSNAQAQNLNAEQQRAYYKDAVQLAGRIVDLSQNTAEIPEELIASMEGVLHAVANSNFEKAKEVVDHYNIHTFPYFNTHEVHLYVEDNVRWAKELADNPDKLKQSPLAAIVKQYDLSFHQLETQQGLLLFSFYSEKPLNMKVVAYDLSLANDVLLAEVPAPAGEGSDIEVKEVKEGWLVTYHLRYTQCDFNCQDRYYWQFGVSRDGEVSFLGEYGTHLPPYYKNGNQSVIVESE